MGFLLQEGSDVLLRVFAKPRASKSRVLALREGKELEIALQAPPVDGAANSELCKFLSKALGLSKSRIVVEKGKASRHKVVRLSGSKVEAVKARLGPFGET